ncbi:DUF1642 domain-containing protein [Enterococcus faecalis]|uniref:DUF1642 domain-containing protein n=1 Tax=Enterococcus faecalis TaxID=1351 RepID=UPI0018E88F7E|nr:DUF1642 domain-containing protein [Enterococcus faecalis]MBJ0372381.1 DUF1642 domain-containing protein [Enterococcus faecalis]
MKVMNKQEIEESNFLDEYRKAGWKLCSRILGIKEEEKTTMNKKELIEKYKTKYAEEPKDWRLPSVNASRQALYSNFINDLEKLDEPKKFVVPKFVDDWIKYAKQQGYGFMQSYDPKYTSYPINDNLDKWIDDNEETFAHAWLVGYEVEKEQLYYVNLPDLRSSQSGNVYGLKKIVNGEIRVGVFDKQEIGKTKDSQLTEQEIKAVDERYWPFAVKVEEAE